MTTTTTTISVTRWVRGYETSRGDLPAEWRLPDSLELKLLQDLFGARREDPMYDCYRLGQAQAEALARWIGRELTDADLEFFLEADAKEH